MNIEEIRIKLKKILCLVFGFLALNSISTHAVENNSNYFLTQKHILKSPELYNFIKDTEKGIFPDISKLDRDQKKELVILFYRLFDSRKEFDKENWEQEFSDEKLDLMRTYFIEYSHPKDVTYYSIGKFICRSSSFDLSGTSPYIKPIQEKLRDKNFSHHYLYMYVIEHEKWEKNIKALKENTMLTDEMIQELANDVYFYDVEVLKQIVTDVNNNSQIKDKNRYLYNYLLAGSYPLLIINDTNFCDVETVYFKRVMKKQKEAINYLENSNINFSSILDNSIKIRKLIYSKNLNIDTLTLEDVYIMYKFMLDYANGRTVNDYVNEYLIKKLSDKNINIINLAYIMTCISFDEAMKPEIEKFFDKGIIDNKFLYENRLFYIRISEVNHIYERLWQKNKITDESLAKAIKKQAISNHKATDLDTGIQPIGLGIGYSILFLVWFLLRYLPVISIVLAIIIGIVVFIKRVG